MASVKINPEAPALYVEPTEIYGSEGPMALRIASGGAGQSGLIRALAEGFIQDFSQQASSQKLDNGLVYPFRACWITSDTSASFNHLAQNAADVSITYHRLAEQNAMIQGIGDRLEYAWRDHWFLVGPKSNPAKVKPLGEGNTIYDQFGAIFRGAVATTGDKEPVRYLSRYDKSASNICESRIWATIGQTPWSHPASQWYHQYIDFPFQALRVASKLGEYTLVDRGTWFSIEDGVTDNLQVFAEGSDREEDPMLNGAHALVGSFGSNRAMANKFVGWLVRYDGGQKVIRDFAVNGHILYTAAPSGVAKE